MDLSKKVAAILLFLPLIAAVTYGQQSSKDSTRATMSHLRVEVLVTEYDGSKKINSLPYTLYLGVTDLEKKFSAPRATLRMGVRVPIATTGVVSPDAATQKQYTQYQYENVGTNIDVGATKLEADLYRLEFTVERTAVSSAREENDASGQSGILPLPTLTNFSSRFELSLRDGQEGEGMSATDPFSGHVMKISVTMHVLK